MIQSSVAHTAQIIPFPARRDIGRPMEMPTVDYSSAAWYHADAILKDQSPQAIPQQVV